MSQQLPKLRTIICEVPWVKCGDEETLLFFKNAAALMRELAEKDPEQIVEMLNARFNAAHAMSLGIVG